MMQRGRKGPQGTLVPAPRSGSAPASVSPVPKRGGCGWGRRGSGATCVSPSVSLSVSPAPAPCSCQPPPHLRVSTRPTGVWGHPWVLGGTRAPSLGRLQPQLRVRGETGLPGTAALPGHAVTCDNTCAHPATHLHTPQHARTPRNTGAHPATGVRVMLHTRTPRAVYNSRTHRTTLQHECVRSYTP